MTEQSLAPPSGAITPEDAATLLDAACAALRYLDDLDKHAPEGFHMSNEGRVRRRLREAVRRCSYEMRPCAACDGGTTLAPTRHPMEVPRIVSCPECGGSGRVRVFTYPTKRTRRA